MPISGFQTTSLSVTTADGRNFTLNEPLEYLSSQGHRYRVPAGSSTDGASTPAVLWPTIPPFGRYWMAACLHDSFYRDTIEIQDIAGDWHKTDITKEYADWLFKEAMLGSGVEEILAETIYQGVNQMGWASFKQDRDLAG